MSLTKSITFNTNAGWWNYHHFENAFTIQDRNQYTGKFRLSQHFPKPYITRVKDFDHYDDAMRYMFDVIGYGLVWC